MITSLLVKGLGFTVEADFPSTAEADFERAADLIETALKALPAAELARLHAGCAADCCGPEAEELDMIAYRASRPAVCGIHG